MPPAIAELVPIRTDPAVASLRWLRARSLDEVDKIEDAWRQMDRNLDNPLSQFNWTRICLAVFGDQAEPSLIALARGAELVAIAPLVKRRQHGVCRLFLAGVWELHEPMDLAWSDRKAMERLVTQLARGRTPLVLARVFADSPSLQSLRRACRGRAIAVCRQQANCPYIALDETWFEPESHLNAGRRSDLRRAHRKAEEQGAVATEIHAPSLDELPQLLDVAFEVEAHSWKGEAGTALLHDAHRAAFYRRYCESASVDGTLRICFLRIGDRVAAMQLAVEQPRSFWLLKVGYDARFARCSPGLLLMRETIRYAAEAGLKSYEFLGRAEEWTRVWTNTERSTVSLRVYPLGIRGMAALVADAAVAAHRKWRTK